MQASTVSAAAAVLLCVAVPLAAQERPDPYKSPLIDSLVYGVYCAEPAIDIEEAPDTAAGVVNIVPGIPEMRAVTTLVPAQLGIGFGVIVEARDGVVFDPAGITITHPPYPDSGIAVERWSTVVDGDGPGLVGFSFEAETELVPGAWTFEAEHAGELLFRVTFEVMPPALLPALSAACGVATLS
ncbi:DUF3859 domain-containing protein [Roseicyclus persicicus]|uniref:DUF3859 domain-containing protein n=1 Tax=Roseicyclus persicicus TaxID=2650661 RepID=A0A7X6JVS3_9RHOB|nr:DUF3859 domain-containing protein [Roseibacterium persicicum]NKX42990.1 DUF3859 domain-containing protein [Roseibacterium persicicum]